MEKIYFGDDDHKNKKLDTFESKITLDILKQKVSDMAIAADVIPKGRFRALVTVHKYVGTTMFMSGEFQDHFWLQNNCVKREDGGGVIKYHFVLD